MITHFCVRITCEILFGVYKARADNPQISLRISEHSRSSWWDWLWVWPASAFSLSLSRPPLQQMLICLHQGKLFSFATYNNDFREHAETTVPLISECKGLQRLAKRIRMKLTKRRWEARKRRGEEATTPMRGGSGGECSGGWKKRPERVNRISVVRKEGSRGRRTAPAPGTPPPPPLMSASPPPSSIRLLSALFWPTWREQRTGGIKFIKNCTRLALNWNYLKDESSE